VVHGQILMDMPVDIADSSASLDELIAGLLAIGVEIGMEIRVTLHNERERAPVAILVSKEPHCLEQLIADRRSGDLPGEIACVLANHPNLEALANEAAVPFA
jgi:formyltetrahydrofolate deformylase